MTAVPATRPAVASGSQAPWLVVGQGAAALAAAMGVGRFAYTPILPLMHAQAGLSAQAGASLATANYAGYLAGAVAATVLPALNRSRAVMRVSLAVLIATLVLMPASHEQAFWLVLRLVAGLASALVFVSGIGAVLSRLRGLPHHLTGWVFSGVGAGIALSGVLVLIVRQESTWSVAWWACAGLALVLSAGAWSLAPARDPGPAPRDPGSSRPRWGWRFGVLLTSYSLEGVGYIIAGTFLVAAIDQDAPGWIGSGAWVLVGLAALPSAVLWAWLGHRWSRPGLLMTLLLIQSAGIALPALIAGVAPALLSAVLFGSDVHRCRHPGRRHRCPAAGGQRRGRADLRLRRRPDPRPAGGHAADRPRLPLRPAHRRGHRGGGGAGGRGAARRLSARRWRGSGTAATR